MKSIAKILVPILLLSLTTPSAMAQTAQRESRAFWLSTVWRLTWPTCGVISKTGDTNMIQKQKNELIMLLDSAQNGNFNTIYFQVRSRCDAMYKSSYEPWSTDLVSTRGLDPGYDPLEFAIEECHKRGMELHAWVNPFRYESQSNQWDGTPQNYREPHPDWVMDYAGASILNPGVPDVRNRITDILQEIVHNYDVDGIVFDDYFYLQGTPMSDDADLYAVYNPNGLNQSDWRREQVNKLVAQVYQMIQGEKPYVKFGISPAGRWTQSEVIAEERDVPVSPGSGWCYDGIYCDAVAWIQEGTIDFISPQIYWTLTSGYGQSTEWWSIIARMYGLHFYSSMSASDLSSAKINDKYSFGKEASYRINGENIPLAAFSSIERRIADEGETIVDGATAAFKGDELISQVKTNRAYDMRNAPGSVFYNMRKVTHTRGMLQLLREEVFSAPALPPAIDWKPAADPGLVSNITLSGTTLSWTGVDNVRYAIYAIPSGSTAKKLMGMAYSTSYTIPQAYRSGYTYAVSIVDRYGNEYAARTMGGALGATPAVTLNSPAEGEHRVGEYEFSWSSVDGATYSIDIARDAKFNDLVFSRETGATTLSSTCLPDLSKGTYYWRVRSRKDNGTTGVSAARSFNSGPFAIESPERASTGVPLTSTISWVEYPSATQYKLEINRYRDFRAMGKVHEQTCTGTSVALPLGVLVGNIKYYARVTATVGGKEVSSKVTFFTTESREASIPVITYPVNGSTVVAETLKVKWEEEPLASSFRVELHTDDTFMPARNVKRQSVNAFTYETEFTDLTDGVWFLRARTEYQGGATEYCDTIQFTFKKSSGIDDLSADGKCRIVQGAQPALIAGRAAQTMTVDIASLSGQIIRRAVDTRHVAAGDRFEFDALLPGVYLLIVRSDDREEILKLVHAH